MIRPLLTYSDLIMQCLSKSNVAKLEKLQGHAETCVFCKTSSERWPSLLIEKRRKVALFIYNCINGLAPHIFNNYYGKVDQGKGTRGDKTNVKIPRTKLEVFWNGIQFQGTWLFNRLPNELKTEG